MEEEKEKQYVRKSKTLIVRCGFPSCTAEPMTEQSLRRHLLNQHGKGVAQKGQKTVPGLFAKKASFRACLVNGSICRDLRAFWGDQPDQKLVVGGPQLIYRTGVVVVVIVLWNLKRYRVRL